MINWSKAQKSLNDLGYTSGPPDGIRGPLTIAACLAYAVQRPISTSVIPEIARELHHIGDVSGLFDSAERFAEFVGETGHETGGYQRFAENMHYSAKRIMEVWPSRFKTLASAQSFAWDPSDPDLEDVALANMVYGSRMGNEANGTADDDGWDNRGGGLLQHTGAGEYNELAKLGITSEDVHGGNPTKMVQAACSYWDRRNVNGAVDAGDFSLARRRVNGGTIGLAEVAAIRNRLLGVLR